MTTANFDWPWSEVRIGSPNPMEVKMVQDTFRPLALRHGAFLFGEPLLELLQDGVGEHGVVAIGELETKLGADGLNLFE